MPDQPSSFAREAKSIHQGIKELLKSKEPFDKEVDFQRKNLRRHYLQLLLVYPYAKEAKDAETHLWMQTSYALIAAFKQRITALDRTMSHNARQNRDGQAQARSNNSHTVEHRKLLQRFRQFLSEEERFWTQLVVRMQRSYGLDEAQSALVHLGILSATSDGQAIENAVNAPPNSRNSYQFPPEHADISGQPQSAEDRANRLAVLSKALICLGDIARYKEQYNESQGRSKAGHEDVPGHLKRGKNKKSGPNGSDAIRPRNFFRAKTCYEQARLLVPNQGNPSHQLAILSAYEKNPFASLVHYYRALCVSEPYDTAAENMGTVLMRTYDQWKRKDRRHIALDSTAPPKIRVDAMTEKIVVLHAIWRLALDRMDNTARKLLKEIGEEFSALLTERLLPDDLIVDIIISSHSALWKYRLVREPPAVLKGEKSTTLLPAYVVEARILTHLLSLHRALFDVALEQLKDLSLSEAADKDLAVLAQHRINPVIRRMLPALRIASKWLRSNISYLKEGAKGLKANQPADSQSTQPTGVYTVDDDTIGIPALWSSYAALLEALSRAFTFEKLPTMRAPLSEDVQMRGFLPLKSVLFDGTDDSIEDQEHPNVLNLMRISDFINDVKMLLDANEVPLGNRDVTLMLKGMTLEDEDTTTSYVHEEPDLAEADRLTEATSQTDDDPVRAAFNFLDSSDRDSIDDEEEIVYLRTPMKSIVPPLASPETPVKAASASESPKLALSSQGKSPLPSPTTRAGVPTTAQDLLNHVMGPPRSDGKLQASSTNPTSSLLFGSDLGQAGHSIWAASKDEQSLKFTAATKQATPVQQPLSPRLPPPPPPPWPATAPMGPYSPAYRNMIPASHTYPDLNRAPEGRHRTLSSFNSLQPLPPMVYSDVGDVSYPASSLPSQHGLPPPSFSAFPQPLPISSSEPMFYNMPQSQADLHSHHMSLHDIKSFSGPMAFPSMPPVWGNGG